MNASFLPPQAGPLLTRHLKMGGANPAGIRPGSDQPVPDPRRPSRFCR